ncbi:hypothetical protein [Anabaena sp. 4-3]|uniref:hypothetical protein n=1 Tax=Anabaena sp. 4-3 TaxID=1811979 RepID=UPI0008366693|nr:hypothetical protein [Anabaena sp. 4-3]
MKNKFLALAAFGAAALGGAIVSAPAHAQIPQGSGPTSDITVNVSVPEVLYLRTIADIDLEITAADLTGATLTPVAGTNPPALIGPNNDTAESPADSVDTASPFAGGFADPAGPGVDKTITSAYIVWSNSPTGTYDVQVDTPASGFAGPGPATVGVDVVGANPRTGIGAEGLVTATAQDITLNLVASDDNITAGSYTGVITVEAYRP